MTAIEQELSQPPAGDMLAPHLPEQVHFIDRLRLGGDEPAICAAFDLGPPKPGANREVPDARLVLMDVGFRRREDGKFGPYDLAGTGDKRVFSSDFVLIAEDKSGDEPVLRYFEVPVGEDVELGRHGPVAEALGYQNNRYVSRKQAVLHITEYGDVEIVDEGSRNGTERRDLNDLNAVGGEEGGDSLGFTYTINIGDYISRAGKSAYYVPPEEQKGWGHGLYGGRPIIARDTPINGGVYPVGGSRGEAIVIDDEKYPERFDQLYDKVLSRLSLKADDLALRGLHGNNGGRKSHEKNELHTLRTVFDEVSRTLRYDLDATNKLARPGQKISLDYYIAEGVGVCRTQAALSAYLIERLIKNGLLEGHASIDRSMARDVDGVGGHAWARFKDRHGRVFIIDPAQHFVGTLEDANRRASWDYRRTEDLVQQLL